VLIAPNVLLSAAHCVNYTSTGTAQIFWGRVGAGNFVGSRVVNFPSYPPANSWSGLIANPSSPVSSC
jgi:hypothetical protein